MPAAALAGMKFAGNEELLETCKPKFQNETAPTCLANLEKLYTNLTGGDGWWVSKKMTWLDVYMATVLEWLPDLAKFLNFEINLDNYPKLMALQAKVFENP